LALTSRFSSVDLRDVVSDFCDFSIEVAIDAPSLSLTFSVIGVNHGGGLWDSTHLVAYSRTEMPQGSVRLATASGPHRATVAFDLTRLPRSVDRLVITASIEGPGTMDQIASGHIRVLSHGAETGRIPLQRQHYSGDKSIILVEIYRSFGPWRLSARAKDFKGDLSDLLRQFHCTAPERLLESLRAPATSNQKKGIIAATLSLFQRPAPPPESEAEFAPMNLSRGARVSLNDIVPHLADFQVQVLIDAPGLVIDYSVFGVDRSNRLSDDRYAVFYNQPASPCGGIRLSVGSMSGIFNLSLAKLPSTIDRLVIVAAIDGAHAMGQIRSGFLRFVCGDRERARFLLSRDHYDAERALIVGELYRKDGAWRFSATGQGFNGGLDALVRHYGGEVDDAPASPLPSPQPARISLEKKIEKEAPHLVSLAKVAGVSLQKHKLTDVTARVGLVLDATGSMRKQYSQGKVQALLDRVLPLAVHFDDDGSLDTWCFANEAAELTPTTATTVRGYIDREGGGWRRWSDKIGGTNYEPAVIRKVIAKYEAANATEKAVPAYVIFVSDGGVSKNQEIANLLIRAAHLPIFWQFVGLGGRNYGILEKLDTMDGRIVDNCSFFALDDLNDISDSELYDRLLTEFPSWLRIAKSKGIIRP